ncbi:hypothetical protein, partial [Kitasatospora nipponensis]|uniref:hypothetical protein n=1 Tax=Kitasatospora nipponensis TaxID=258049 RepID=UPI0031D5CCBF
IYLNTSAATPNDAFFHATLACLAVVTLSLVLALLANRSTPRSEDDPSGVTGPQASGSHRGS